MPSGRSKKRIERLEDLVLPTRHDGGPKTGDSIVGELVGVDQNDAIVFGKLLVERSGESGAG